MKLDFHKNVGYVFYASLLLLFGSCSLFEQNDYILTREVFSDTKEKIIYKIFQTGIDNYTFEFMAVSETSDTTKLFDANLNDATYTAGRVKYIYRNDSIIISTNLLIITTSSKTPSGKIIILQPEN